MTNVPRLFEDLRHALALLYGLPTGMQKDASSLSSSHDAHSFLMDFQSRNVRRKLQSIQQRQLDLAKRGGSKVEESSDLHDLQSDEGPIVWGSSWLASLMVLFHPDTHFSERLFCAQTLIHRLRRSKMSEAIDIEIESSPGVYHEGYTMVQYQKWIHAINPSLGSILQHHMETSLSFSFPSNKIPEEERGKCELALLTIAWLACHYSFPMHDHTMPLLSTLGASMAAITLRLRYTPQSMAQGLPASSTPIVQAVLQALYTVSQTWPQQSVELFFLPCAGACLGSIPDTILSTPGGATGRISIDPRCLAAAHEELRNPETGVYLLWKALSTNVTNAAILLWTLERWAKYLPLPWEGFVEPSLHIVRSEIAQPYAMAYLVAIFEGATKTPDQILCFSLGIDTPATQTSKKKQSSKSKKRHKEILQDVSTEVKRHEATAEFHYRGDVACKTVTTLWMDLHSIIFASPQGYICLCACANACLPHWITYPPNSLNVVQSIMAAFQSLCSHSHRDIRGQTFEPLCNLHAYMKDEVNSPLQAVMIEHLFHSTMRLANSCGYPTDYFENLAENNEDEIEIERNDVRDLIRVVTGGEDIYSGAPEESSIRVLNAIVKTCVDCILNQSTPNGLPRETAVHALSALAKPLFILVESYVRNELPFPYAMESFVLTLQGFSVIASKLIEALPTLQTSQVFAISRLFNLGVASLCPVFSLFCNHAQGLPTEWNDTIQSILQAAALSVVHIPELAVESTLDQCQFDIRGAFRSPGGEDHVGILVFMRFSTEGEELATRVVRLGHENGKTFLMDLCHLHDTLKQIEIERGPGIHHGKGVTPRTRRILLETISRFTVVALSDPELAETCGFLANKKLHQLFHTSCEKIVRHGMREVNASIMNDICEEAYDIASFSSSLISSLFTSSEPLISDCINTLIRACVFGYESAILKRDCDKLTLLQWGRFRGALTRLFKNAANPDLCHESLNYLIALIISECKSIIHACQQGPASESSIFVEQIVSSENLAAGAFLHVIAESAQGKTSIPLCYLQALVECSGPVLEALIHQCPRPTNPTFVDARPALCEAWFKALISLTNVDISFTEKFREHISLRNKLITETSCAAIILILYPSLEIDPSKRLHDFGMSMDGAHSLAAMEFFEKTFELGPDQLRQIASDLQNVVKVDLLMEDDAILRGMAILGAGLLRAAAGGLPPWAVECVPATYAAFYRGCGKDSKIFQTVLRASMIVRLSSGGPTLGSVRPGSLLAGRIFETMKQAQQDDFLQKATEIAVKDNMEGWRRFKTLVKQISGGKKKASGFNLKPSPTTWECDRL